VSTPDLPYVCATRGAAAVSVANLWSCRPWADRKLEARRAGRRPDSAARS
jgi:hypothetical protein